MSPLRMRSGSLRSFTSAQRGAGISISFGSECVLHTSGHIWSWRSDVPD